MDCIGSIMVKMLVSIVVDLLTVEKINVYCQKIP